MVDWGINNGLIYVLKFKIYDSAAIVNLFAMYANLVVLARH